jgi:hypothetical protein
MMDKYFSIELVGMTGLEPAASRPPDEHSTGLSYIPNSIMRLQISKCNFI